MAASRHLIKKYLGNATYMKQIFEEEGKTVHVVFKYLSRSLERGRSGRSNALPPSAPPYFPTNRPISYLKTTCLYSPPRVFFMVKSKKARTGGGLIFLV